MTTGATSPDRFPRQTRALPGRSGASRENDILNMHKQTNAYKQASETQTVREIIGSYRVKYTRYPVRATAMSKLITVRYGKCPSKVDIDAVRVALETMHLIWLLRYVKQSQLL